MGSSNRAELDALVAEAVVDAYDDDEQFTVLYTMIEDNLAMPFTTQVLGVEVTVRRVDLCVMVRSWRSVTEADSDSRSVCPIYRCRTRRRRARSGSRHTGTGRPGDHSW